MTSHIYITQNVYWGHLKYVTKKKLYAKVTASITYNY
jgi:hypothetical protein